MKKSSLYESAVSEKHGLVIGNISLLHLLVLYKNSNCKNSCRNSRASFHVIWVHSLSLE